MKKLQEVISDKNSPLGKIIFEEIKDQLDSIPDEEYDFPVSKKEILDFLKTPPSENPDN